MSAAAKPNADESRVQYADANGIRLAYEEMSSEGEPLILIMGLGSQMLKWRAAMCELFAEAGFRVIRFDNRDCGLSTRFDDAPFPSFPSVLMRSTLGLPGKTPYDLYDMADDVAGLLDHLGFEQAHVVGSSMGGMIAQAVAIRHEQRVRSLTSIMSSPGRLRDLIGEPKVMRAISKKAPTEREAAIDHLVDIFRLLHGAGHRRFDEEGMREVVTGSYERGLDQKAVARQMRAIIASGRRTKHLAKLEVPTQILHGSHDPLVSPKGGHATHRAIPGSKLEIIDGMGHGMPPCSWEQIVGAVRRNADEGNERARKS